MSNQQQNGAIQKMREVPTAMAKTLLPLIDAFTPPHLTSPHLAHNLPQINKQLHGSVQSYTPPHATTSRVAMNEAMHWFTWRNVAQCQVLCHAHSLPLPATVHVTTLFPSYTCFAVKLLPNLSFRTPLFRLQRKHNCQMNRCLGWIWWIERKMILEEALVKETGATAETWMH